MARKATLDSAAGAAGPPPLRRAHLIGTALLLIGGIYCLDLYTAVAAGQVTSFDDAYSFVRYAHNFLAGQGLVWNAGTAPVYGPTSLPYVFVVALFMRFSQLQSGLLLPWISWSLGLLLLALLCAFVVSQTRTSTTPVVLLGLGTLAWIVATPFFAYHATAGMDTMLSMLTTTVLALAWLRLRGARPRNGALILAVCAYACYAVRPDNLIYALLFPLLACLIGEPAPRWREAFLFAAMLLALLAMDTAVKFWIFGDPLPLSFYVKQNGFYTGYRDIWNPIVYICAFSAGLLPNLLILLTCMRRAHLRLLLVCLLPVAVTFTYYFSVIQIMGQLARYYYPALPFVVVASIVVLSDVHELPTGPEFRPAARRLVLATVGLGGFLLAAVLWGAPTYDGHFNAATPENTLRLPSPAAPKLGWWESIEAVSSVIEPLAPGTRVAASEIGFLAASAPQASIIDLTGLNDPYFAHHGVSAPELFRRQPDIIWLPLSAYTAVWKEIVCSADLYRDYIYYPDAFDYGIAVRRASPSFAEIRASLTRTWGKFYSSPAAVGRIQSSMPALCLNARFSPEDAARLPSYAN